jgi:hypothetical protein
LGLWLLLLPPSTSSGKIDDDDDEDDDEMNNEVVLIVVVGVPGIDGDGDDDDDENDDLARIVGVAMVEGRVVKERTPTLHMQIRRVVPVKKNSTENNEPTVVVIAIDSDDWIGLLQANYRNSTLVGRCGGGIPGRFNTNIPSLNQMSIE